MLALLFGLGVYFVLGHDTALKFITGYLLEESLSLDNLFVFLVIFTYFSVPATSQHKVLYWGILGALIMRAIFIGTGLFIVERIHWVIYIFGAFLLYTGIRLSLNKDKQINPEKNPVLRIMCRFLPVTNDYHNDRFFVRENGRFLVTPLLLVLVVIETTDVIFAVDSVPAILAVSLDPFVVYTSNVFAILGLRSLYFALAAVAQKIRYLNYGLSAILILLGFKMLTSSFYEMPIGLALGLVALILSISVIASIIVSKRKI